MSEPSPADIACSLIAQQRNSALDNVIQLGVQLTMMQTQMTAKDARIAELEKKLGQETAASNVVPIAGEK